MNLILCYTPLQILIAERIIELYPNEKFYGVMIYSTKNKKIDYYQQRFAKKCVGIFSLHQKIDRLGLLLQLVKLKSYFWGKRFDKVFLASLNDLQMQVILSTIKFNQFYSFDDGTANIVPMSCFYQDEPNTIIRKWINLLFRNCYSVKKLKEISEKHYTIYPYFPNIIENTLPIKLETNFNSAVFPSESIKSILLGQPVYLDNKKNIELAEKVIKKFGIDYYLPHPREQYRVNDVQYLDTPLIFEDYIRQQRKQYYRIYTYFSSAALNVMNFDNIDITVLKIELDNPDFINCYDLFYQAGVNIIDIRDITG